MHPTRRRPRAVLGVPIATPVRAGHPVTSAVAAVEGHRPVPPPLGLVLRGGSRIQIDAEPVRPAQAEMPPPPEAPRVAHAARRRHAAGRPAVRAAAAAPGTAARSGAVRRRDRAPAAGVTALGAPALRGGRPRRVVATRVGPAATGVLPLVLATIGTVPPPGMAVPVPVAATVAMTPVLPGAATAGARDRATVVHSPAVTSRVAPADLAGPTVVDLVRARVPAMTPADRVRAVDSGVTPTVAPAATGAPRSRAGADGPATSGPAVRGVRVARVSRDRATAGELVVATGRTVTAAPEALGPRVTGVPVVATDRTVTAAPVAAIGPRATGGPAATTAGRARAGRAPVTAARAGDRSVVAALGHATALRGVPVTGSVGTGTGIVPCVRVARIAPTSR